MQVFGGVVGSTFVTDPIYAKGVWQFNDSPPKWTEMETTGESVQVYGHCCVAVNGTQALLVLGGRVKEVLTNMLVFKLDLVTKAWSPVVTRGEPVKNRVCLHYLYATLLLLQAESIARPDQCRTAELCLLSCTSCAHNNRPITMSITSILRQYNTQYAPLVLIFLLVLIHIAIATLLPRSL